METCMIRFLKKFIVALYLNGIREIPCYGDSYENGITAMDNSLSEMLEEEAYDIISDLFLTVPVQGIHEAFAHKLFALNGQGLSFASLKNPFWKEATINEMKPITIQKINNAITPGIELTDEQYSQLANVFCEAAGI